MWPGSLGYVAGVWNCCNLAVFSLTAIQMVGMLADETERQRESLPKAYRRIPKRILSYYIPAILVLGITVSSDDLLLANGPIRNYPGVFIIMAERAGIHVLPHIINLVMILAIWSAATADIYFSVLPLEGSHTYSREPMSGGTC
jgi:yeast amino acid transporter